MKYRQLFLLAALAAAGACSASAADATGKWKAEFDSPIGHLKYTYDLTADSGKITGKAFRDVDGAKSDTEVKEGKIDGDTVSFVEIIRPQDDDVRIEYSGKITGDEMKLTRKVGDIATMEIVAKRDTAAVAPAAAPSVAGKWRAEFDTQIGKQKST